MSERYMSKTLWASAWARIKTLLAGKVDAVEGKGLSTCDYTAEDKAKLDGMESGANQTDIVNTLDSTSTTSALSAAQGKALADKINAITTDIGNLGGGDMMRATYDADADGVVDDAARLGGALPETYGKADGTNVKATFTPASARANIVSGEALPTILGKIAKYFGDLKGVAFSGSYADLVDAPTIPSVTNDLTNTLKSQYDAAYTHSTSAHAPADAEANVITEIKINGVAQVPVAKAVNLAVPTMVAELADAADYAKKSDLTSVYRYKGSVATYADLPAGAETGDVYDVADGGMNYGWTGTDWDPLGQIFTIESMTEADLDEIMAE